MSKQILVVDDDPDAREIFSNIMRFLGYKVDTARNGEEALNKIGQAAPDLMILDLMMPKVNGFEVIAEMNKSRLIDKIPVVVISALEMDRSQMLRLPGVRHTFRKGSFAITELRRMVNELLAEGEKAQSAA